LTVTISNLWSGPIAPANYYAAVYGFKMGLAAKTNQINQAIG